MPPINPGSIALARAMSKALRAMEDIPAEVAGAVNEHVAAARLGVSLDVLRKDRKLGRLGIPFIKIGEGKRGLVRYDLADLDVWIESKKRRTLPVARPVAEVRAPATPVAPGLPAIDQEELPELPVERIDPPMPVRRSPPRSMWDALADRYAEEPEDDPFAKGRSPQRRGPSGYFSG